jgi:hypothetical protein
VPPFPSAVPHERAVLAVRTVINVNWEPFTHSPPISGERGRSLPGAEISCIQFTNVNDEAHIYMPAIWFESMVNAFANPVVESGVSSGAAETNSRRSACVPTRALIYPDKVLSSPGGGKSAPGKHELVASQKSKLIYIHTEYYSFSV